MVLVYIRVQKGSLQEYTNLQLASQQDQTNVSIIHSYLWWYIMSSMLNMLLGMKSI